MGHDSMDLDDLARYLRRDARELAKLVNRGHLPGRKVGGEWRFVKTEIHSWLETQLAAMPDEQLRCLDANPELSIGRLLSPECVAVPLQATTRASTLRNLITLAEQSWQVYDPEAILAAVQSREMASSTALPGGVAIPHPGRPMPGALGEPVIAFGRTSGGVPFGASDRGLTDLFFLILCPEAHTHLHILARLMRLIQRPEFLPDLRACESAAETHRYIIDAEARLL